MIFTIEDIIRAVKENAKTMIAVDINGSIKNIIFFKDDLSPEQHYELIIREVNKDCSVSFIQQNKNISEKEIKKKIQESVEALKYSQTHNLKPGTNIPVKKGDSALFKKRK